MSKFSRKKFISNIKRVVLKIGSSILTDNDGNLFEPRFGQLATQIVEIRKKGLEVIVVSSGAIASGMKKLNLRVKPSEIHIKQAIAACGQSSLIWNYEKAFSKFGVNVAQILLTHDGLADRKRFLNARKTIHQLLEMNIIPIVNENDSVAVEEIMIGDNDNLASLVTSLTEAELMVLLTNIDGIYKEDPRKNSDAEFISLVEVIDNNLEKLAGDTTGNTTTGGMITKIEAIKKASVFGVPSIISNGETEDVLQKIFNGEEIGTLILPSKEKLSARKHWIAFNLQIAGEIVVDNGARDAITSKGKSLLPSGIKEIRGNFGIGDSILCIDVNGNEIARGITSYSSKEIKKIAGRKTTEIEKILGYKYSDEVIHRDDLAVIRKNDEK
ncbi:MAG: glutamate 5-kinase [Thermodesulfobacteriota bacterium]